MKIGIDFDNTIVEYDELFFAAALDKNLIPTSVEKNKQAVRDYLRQTGREDEWTELQGYVYGARMNEARAFPGVPSFFKKAQAAGHEIFIVSHKTARPFRGPEYDLHRAAYDWITTHLVETGTRLVPEENVFFELTLLEKLQRISQLGCHVFIDDLMEVLTHPDMPSVRKINFSTSISTESSEHSITIIDTWSAIEDHLLGGA